MLAISMYNKKDNIKMSWIYNGREDINAMSSVGLLFRSLPVALKLEDKRTLRDIYSDVHTQIQDSIKYCCYPYVDITYNVGSEETAFLLYQQDIRDGSDLGDMNIETIDIRQNQAASQTILDIEILDGEEGLETMIDYASSKYKDESMVKFKDLFIKVVHIMAKYTAQKDITVYDLRKEIKNENNIFKIFSSIFSRKG